PDRDRVRRRRRRRCRAGGGAVRARRAARSGRRLPRRRGAGRGGDAGVGARVVGRRADRVRAARGPGGGSAAARRAARSRARLRIPGPDDARRVSPALSSSRVGARRRARSLARDRVASEASRMIEYDAFLSRAAGAMQASEIRKMGALAARVPDLISFAPGYPAPEVFAWDAFRSVADAVLGGSDPDVLQYGPTRGYRPLVEALPAILGARGIAATPEQMLVTTGSQQALDLTARVFIDPGDVVLVELPTYTGAITAFRNAQASLVGVRQDADGIDLDDLDRVAARERSAGRRIAFLYVVPNFQN